MGGDEVTFSREDYEAKIRQLEDDHARSVALSVSEAQRYAADLAAARGVTARLREALLSGATDAARATALGYAFNAAESREIERLDPRAWALCTDYLALYKEHRATLVRLQKIADLAYVLGMGHAK